MDDEIRLSILRLIEERPSVSQRELARELGVSVGKTNYCLRALVDKGLVKARNFRNARNRRGYAYRLTPLGIRTRAQATLEFLRRKQDEYERIRREIDLLVKEAQQARRILDR